MSAGSALGHCVVDAVGGGGLTGQSGGVSNVVIYTSEFASSLQRVRSHCIRFWPIFCTGVHCRHRQKKQMRLKPWFLTITQ
jgi:hypothetical protein